VVLKKCSEREWKVKMSGKCGECEAEVPTSHEN
jgi:hypothetical protein